MKLTNIRLPDFKLTVSDIYPEQEGILICYKQDKVVGFIVCLEGEWIFSKYIDISCSEHSDSSLRSLFLTILGLNKVDRVELLEYD